MESLRVEGSLMFARLLVCVGLLAFPCFGLVGCGDEAPVSSVETVPEDAVVREVTKLVKTIPASGEDAAEHLPVVLYFDKEPLAVTVNGTAARVRGNRAFWCFPNPRPRYDRDQLFQIEWTNPDGSPNIGTYIRLTVGTYCFAEPEILAGSVADGDADVDPDPLNRGGIRYDFDEPVIGLKSKLLTEDGEDLGWEAVWDDQTLIFHPGASGKLLENGRLYRIKMVVAPQWINNENVCDCMDCSWNFEWTIRFITVGK